MEKLNKISLEKLEMNVYFGGKQSTNITELATKTPDNPSCSDTRTTTDHSDGTVSICETWTC